MWLLHFEPPFEKLKMQKLELSFFMKATICLIFSGLILVGMGYRYQYRQVPGLTPVPPLPNEPNPHQQRAYISYAFKELCMYSKVGQVFNFEMGRNQLTYSKKRKTLSPKHDQFRVFFIDILLFQLIIHSIFSILHVCTNLFESMRTTTQQPMSQDGTFDDRVYYRLFVC